MTGYRGGMRKFERLGHPQKYGRSVTYFTQAKIQSRQNTTGHPSPIVGKRKFKTGAQEAGI